MHCQSGATDLQEDGAQAATTGTEVLGGISLLFPLFAGLSGKNIWKSKGILPTHSIPVDITRYIYFFKPSILNSLIVSQSPDSLICEACDLITLISNVLSHGPVPWPGHNQSNRLITGIKHFRVAQKDCLVISRSVIILGMFLVSPPEEIKKMAIDFLLYQYLFNQ